MGCQLQFDTHYLYEESQSFITSQSLFSIEGNVYTETTEFLPVEIYNPNNYEIEILCDAKSYQIPAHETITIKPEVFE